MRKILVGTCSWADQTLVKDSNFYPPWAKSSETRLQYYQSQFDVVEVDSSYYSMPSEVTSKLWVERTNGEFVFDIKAFRLFTHHPTPVESLPKDIRQALPLTLIEEKKNLYYQNVPEELSLELWRRFETALAPLKEATRLGVILFQFPPWFYTGSKQRDYILFCKERLSGFTLAIEFRNNTWLNEKNSSGTIEYLHNNSLPYVCVDEPQGFKSSVPSLAITTSKVSLVRFHGRNKEAWEKPGIETTGRFNYLYSEEELKEWVPKIRNMAEHSEQVHVLFNNHWRDRAVTNGQQMKALLENS
ncbi:MAG: DUF72 domain-containing protein [Chloroflexi bacterium]|nr:DUF72 domain-containing protein [Chloroflexota bacterium]